MNKDIDTLLRSYGLTRVANQLEQIALPSIRIVSTAIRESLLSPGTSKLGDLPDLPPEIEWPTWNDVPLAFIAQINLAEVHPFDKMGVLPPSGLLSFFYDADHLPVCYDPAWRGGVACPLLRWDVLTLTPCSCSRIPPRETVDLDASRPALHCMCVDFLAGDNPSTGEFVVYPNFGSF